MRVRIALRAHLILTVLKLIGNMRSVDRVDSHSYAAVHGILKSSGEVYSAGDESVLLVLCRARAYSDICKHIVEIHMIVGIEHLVGCRQSALRNRAQVHLSKRDNARLNIRATVMRVGIVQDTLVSLALGAGLIGVDTRHDEQLVLDLIGDLGKPRHVIAYRVRIICRARPDNERLALIAAVEYRFHLSVPIQLNRLKTLAERYLRLNLLRRRQCLNYFQH